MGTVDQGRDTYCVDSLVTGRLATGKQLVGQRLYHRLITVRGELVGGEDEADFGEDVVGFVGATETADLASMLPVRVRNGLMKDPAVSDVDVAAVRTVVNGEETWTLTINAQTTAGDVTLIVSVNDVSASMIGVQ